MRGRGDRRQDRAVRRRRQCRRLGRLLFGDLRQGRQPVQVDIKDLKGKTIGLVDPNSTSGYNAPRFFLDKPGI